MQSSGAARFQRERHLATSQSVSAKDPQHVLPLCRSQHRAPSVRRLCVMTNLRNWRPRQAIPQDAPGQSGSVYAKRPPAPVTGPGQGNPLGVAALAAGVCGTALYWLPWVNLVCPVVSMVLGGIALGRAGKGTGASRLPGVAGLVLGGALFLLGLFVIDVALGLAPES